MAGKISCELEFRNLIHDWLPERERAPEPTGLEPFEAFWLWLEDNGHGDLRRNVVAIGCLGASRLWFAEEVGASRPEDGQDGADGSVQAKPDSNEPAKRSGR